MKSFGENADHYETRVRISLGKLNASSGRSRRAGSQRPDSGGRVEIATIGIDRHGPRDGEACSSRLARAPLAPQRQASSRRRPDLLLARPPPLPGLRRPAPRDPPTGWPRALACPQVEAVDGELLAVCTPGLSAVTPE